MDGGNIHKDASLQIIKKAISHEEKTSKHFSVIPCQPDLVVLCLLRTRRPDGDRDSHSERDFRNICHAHSYNSHPIPGPNNFNPYLSLVAMPKRQPDPDG
jgi:hypothetical protein